MVLQNTFRAGSACHQAMIFGVRGNEISCLDCSTLIFQISPGMAIGAQFRQIRFFGGEQNNPDSVYRYSDRKIPVKKKRFGSGQKGIKNKISGELSCNLDVPLEVTPWGGVECIQGVTVIPVTIITSHYLVRFGILPLTVIDKQHTFCIPDH